MQPESPKLLEDARLAAEFIIRVTHGQTPARYDSDEILRSAVERKFMIIGEAMVRLRKADPATAEMLPDLYQIIAFRNILAHGYDVISNQRVWAVIENHLPVFLEAVTRMLPT